MDPLLVTSADALGRLVDRLLVVDRFAVDTEFHRERTYWPHLALVQVAWPAGAGGPAGVALIDPLAVDIGRLCAVLAGPATMVAHAADQDLEVLERVCDRGPTRLFDTQIAAGFAGHGSSSLATLSRVFLDVSVAKGDRLTDWRRRPLDRVPDCVRGVGRRASAGVGRRHRGRARPIRPPSLGRGGVRRTAGWTARRYQPGSGLVEVARCPPVDGSGARSGTGSGGVAGTSGPAGRSARPHRAARPGHASHRPPTSGDCRRPRPCPRARRAPAQAGAGPPAPGHGGAGEGPPGGRVAVTALGRRAQRPATGCGPGDGLGGATGAATSESRLA